MFIPLSDSELRVIAGRVVSGGYVDADVIDMLLRNLSFEKDGIQAIEAERDSLVDQVQFQAHAAVSLRKEAEDFEAERDALRAEVAAYKARNIDMEISQMDHALHNMRTENAQLRAEVERLKRLADAAQDHEGEVVMQNARLRAALAEALRMIGSDDPFSMREDVENIARIRAIAEGRKP